LVSKIEILAEKSGNLEEVLILPIMNGTPTNFLCKDAYNEKIF
jgi:hypothetical protein